MIAWLTILPLRFKLYGILIGGLLLTLLTLWTGWRLSSRRYKDAAARAQALEAARNAEKRIADRRSELREKQRLIREELAAREARDGFDGQGWGP